MSTRSKLRVESLESRTTPSLTPVGPELQVNTVTQQQQWFPSVAASADGQYVVAFTGYDPIGPGSHYGVYFRQFDSNGVPLANQQFVAATVDLTSNIVSVASNANGDFVVSWIDIGLSGPITVNARRFNHDGTPLGAAFLVSSVSGGDASDLDSAMDANGNVTIVWLEYGSQNRVLARSYANNGSPLSDPIVVSPNAGGLYPAVTIAPNGVATVLWYSYVTGTHELRVQQLDVSGQLLGNTLVVNESPADSIGRNPAITALADSSLVVTYVFYSTPAIVVYRHLSSGGVPLSLSVPVGTGYDPVIAADALGHFAIAYNTATLTESDIRIKQFSNSGSTVGVEYTLNVSSPMSRSFPSLALDADGDGFVAWNDFGSVYNNLDPGHDGSSYGVFARRLVGDSPSLRSATINNGSPSKSEVKSATLTFTRQLVLPTNPASAFTLTGPNGTIPVSVDQTASTPAGAKLKFTFPTYPNGLPDGRYTLRAIAAQIHDTAGQLLDGNGDGVPGDDYVMNFHRLLGDFDGDGAVAASDFILFRLAIGSNNLTFDLDGDGTVGAGDFIYFRLTFGNAI